MNSLRQYTKKTFLTKGTCSCTYFHILNREFGHIKENHEKAADPLAGGIMKEGEQCGMLWGASLAVGAEAFRRREKPGQEVGLAISATKHLMESFSYRVKNINCRDIIDINLKSKFGLMKLILFKARSCMNLAGKWSFEAVQAAKEGLTLDNLPDTSLSCASEVVKQMGGTDEEIVMAAGLAGGIGLSGNGCGALGAAIWMASLKWIKENPGKMVDSNPYATNKLIAFYDETNCEVLCHKIAGKQFNSLNDHSEFINNGGCNKLINVLAQS